MTWQSAILATRRPSGAAALSPPHSVTVDVIAYAPVAFFHCMHCELIWQESPARIRDRREQLDTSLPDDLKYEYQRLSDWVRGMVAAHGSWLRFRIIDAASVVGVVKSLWHGIRRYPAVIVDGQALRSGASFEGATVLIERRLAAVAG
jgi:hypothetical protein